MSKYNKNYLSLSCFFFLLLVFSQVNARNVEGLTTEWAPHFGTDLENQGVMTVIVKEAFKRGGHKANLDFIPWSRALEGVKDGKGDFVMGAYFNQERAEIYDYSEPVYYIDVGLVTLRGQGVDTMESLLDLRPFSIGVNLGDAHTEEFDAADYLNKEVAPSGILNIRKLYRQRVDMIAGAFDVIRATAVNEEKDLEQLVFVQPPLQRNALYIMISRSIPDGKKILKDFNKGLASMRADGTLAVLLKQYLGRE